LVGVAAPMFLPQNASHVCDLVQCGNKSTPFRKNPLARTRSSGGARYDKS
jgi:hypothetical protein